MKLRAWMRTLRRHNNWLSVMSLRRFGICEKLCKPKTIKRFLTSEIDSLEKILRHKVAQFERDRLTWKQWRSVLSFFRILSHCLLDLCPPISTVVAPNPFFGIQRHVLPCIHRGSLGISERLPEELPFHSLAFTFFTICTHQDREHNVYCYAQR